MDIIDIHEACKVADGDTRAVSGISSRLTTVYSDLCLQLWNYVTLTYLQYCTVLRVNCLRVPRRVGVGTRTETVGIKVTVGARSHRLR